MNSTKKRIKKVMRNVLSIPMHFFWLFPIKRNCIIFQSFNGKNYSDSCKAMIEYLHEESPGYYKMYWVTEDESGLKLPNYSELRYVKKFTIRYFYLCLTAQVAVCNINQECDLPIRKKQKLVNVWHGMPYKTLGLDRAKENTIPNYNKYSLFLSPCKFFTEEVIRNSFRYDGDVLNCGLPRNDLLFRKVDGKFLESVKDSCEIDFGKKIALFAPTFRGDFDDIDTHLDFLGVTDALRKRFGGEWVLLYRAHPMLLQKGEVLEGAINVTSYPDIMDLLVVSDVLITDYSSSMWDFALTGKPVFLYAPDLQDYTKDRGFYFDMEKLPFPLGHDNNELQSKIVNFDDKYYRYTLESYFNEMGSFEQGHACEKLAQKIEQWCG